MNLQNILKDLEEQKVQFKQDYDIDIEPPVITREPEIPIQLNRHERRALKSLTRRQFKKK